MPWEAMTVMATPLAFDHPPDREAQSWDQMVPVQTGGAALKAHLADGWEPYAVTAAGGAQVYYHLRRPLAAVKDHQ